VLLGVILKYLYDSYLCDACLKRKRVATNVVEICLSDIESFRNALEGGANSVELCVDRAAGGVSPSYGFISECCRYAVDASIEVNVLIRPRQGNFVYTDDEFDVMISDIIAAKSAGADGVVVGILRSDLSIDVVRMAIVRAISHPMRLTFHRAFDVCSTHLVEALEEIIALGCDRLLTSGRALSAGSKEGAQRLKKMVDHISARPNCSLQIIAAAGVNITNASALIHSTGVHGIHAGSSVLKPCTANRNSENHSAVTAFDDKLTSGTVDVNKVAVLVENAMDSWLGSMTL